MRRNRRYPDLPRDQQRVQADVDDEIHFDIDMRTRELVGQGVSADAARAQAVREFGNVEETRAYCASLDASAERAARRTAWIGDLREDVLLAWRGMRRAPAFAFVVLVTLAMGIGANTAIFSVVRRLLIDRLPYRAADELVRVYSGTGPRGGSDFLTPRELVDLAQAPSLAGVAAFGSLGGVTYYGEESTEMFSFAAVTPNFFGVLGARAQVGRAIGEQDVGPDARPVALISDAIWQRVFGGDPRVIGRPIQLGTVSRTVIGVMPPDFVSPTFTAEVWIPLDLRPFIADPVRSRINRAFRGIARVKSGVSLERVRSDGATISARWRDARPGSPDPIPPRVVPLRDAMVGDVGRALVAVMGAAVVVLVITCINIAGLFLARATARRRELAVRAALGAGRGRLIRQLLAESALYGIGGGALGIAVAFAAKNVLTVISAGLLPRFGEIHIDVALLATAASVSVLCGIAFGLFPALVATRVDLKDSLSESSRSSSAGASRTRGRQVLVTSQIALAMVLMIGAGLLLRSFAALVTTDLGYSSDDHVLTFRVEAPPSLPTNQTARNAFFADVLSRIHAVPGVKSAGFTNISPWNGPNSVRPRTVAGSADDVDAPSAAYITATEEYFAAAGTKILRGRSIRAEDRPSAAPVVLISDSLSRRLFPAGNAIGSQILFEGGEGSSLDQWREVIGVVADVREHAGGEPVPAVYVSDWQEDPWRRPEFVVRTTGNAAALVPALRRMLREVSPRSPLLFPRTLREVVHSFMAPQELAMTLFTVFATLALALAALGVYAVMAYIVTARTREFGIRSALGAGRASVMVLVLRQGMVATGVGSAAGLILAVGGARVIEGLIAGVSVHDWITFVAAPVVLLAVTLSACMIPARVAVNVQPVDALRAE